MLLRTLRREHDKKLYIFVSAPPHSLHRDDEKKITFSPIANCYYVHYVVIMPKKYLPYSCYVHYVVIMLKKYFPYSHSVHYAVITRKTNVFFSALPVLHPGHNKKYNFFYFRIFMKKTPIATFVIMAIFFSLFLHSLRCD